MDRSPHRGQRHNKILPECDCDQCRSLRRISARATHTAFAPPAAFLEYRRSQIGDGRRRCRSGRDILPHEIPDDRAYAEIFDKAYTMTARDGLETLMHCSRPSNTFCQNTVRGDTVECGVWRGGINVWSTGKS
jgi:Macrocin-O-methyltransferase (TylF)